MSEMVERVAKALHKAHYERGRGLPPSWDAIDRFEREMWLFSARAAIEAMREPTRDMISAANRNNHPRDIDTWQTMIDAALGKVNA